MAIVYGMRVNINVAIVTMVNHTARNEKGNDSEKGHKAICAADSTDNSSSASTHPDGPFLWGNTEEGLVLSSFFIGYAISQLPGGRAAEVYSAKWVMFFAVASNLAATLLTPVMSSLHSGACIFMRIIIGLGGGVTYPTMHVVIAHWSPPLERSIISSIVYAGTAMGTVVFMLLSGLIAGYLGWEYVFYIEGGACSIWLVIWALLVTDYPQQHKYISKEEKEYIMTSLHQTDAPKKAMKIPWKSMCSSKPFWALFICNSTLTWGWYMLLTEIPSYMKEVLDFEIKKSAWITALPFLCMWLFALSISKVLDVLRTKGTISTSFARKTANMIATIGPALCLTGLCYIGCDQYLGVALMTIGVMCLGSMFCGVLSNHIDIAPNFAGTLMGFTNSVGTIPGIVVPNMISALVANDPSINSWRIAFFTAVAAFLLQAVVFTIWGSGEEQEWNNPNKEEEKPSGV